MAEVISPYALTTLQRVKDRIFDSTAGASQPSNFDTVLTRMINSITDWFERECGNRRFVQTTYTNEIYSAYGPSQKRIITRQAPIIFLTVTGNTSNGSTTISAISNTTAMVVGMPIQGDGIQAGTVISTINNTSLVISKAATATGTTTYLQVNGLIKFQWRAGTPSNPAWQDFLVDQYEVVNDGKAGIIRIYGAIPRLYNNMIRATYSAGYPVNWTNAGDNSTHMLPSQITDVVENMVTRRFKRRLLAGKGTEGLEGAQTSWNREIDAEDQDVIDQFRRMPTIF